ncbi:MAG: aldehyde ferredoxin oxidoreductase, partial [Desulfobacteraceae bacterium]|nr:aldehyde ferredoxin oxidoreductase [Desulfobacteraceae bacterium]
MLRIDVGADSGPEASISDLGDYAGMGGRGMTSMVISQEVPADCHPLGPENKLVIAPGLMAGTAASTSGRISIGCKSPLTGGIKEANAGGQAGQVLARLGYAAMILEGQPKGDDTYKIFISKEGVKIAVANELKGLMNYDLADKVKSEY